MNSKQLLAMASRRKWVEFCTVIAQPENHGLASELMPQLEELGDLATGARSWADASNCYQCAVLCATIRMQDPAAAGSLLRLSGKLNASQRELAEERAHDSNGPYDWIEGTQRVIELARMERYAEAEALLRRLDPTDDSLHEHTIACGRRLEQQADELPKREKQLVKWLREQALSRFQIAQSQQDIERLQRRIMPPPAPPQKPKVHEPSPPPVDLDSLVRQLTALVLNRQRGAWRRLLHDPRHRRFAGEIAERFENLADLARSQGELFQASEFYAIAGAACGEATQDSKACDPVRIAEKAHRTMLAAVEEKISHPLLDELAEDPSDWTRGWHLAESLALAGRFADADALLIRLQALPDDDYERGFELPGRFESIGDYLLPQHPEIARWFYEIFREQADALPADSAYQGNVRQGIVDTAVQKIAEANARLPKRIATVQLALSGQGMGLRPEPELAIATVGNDELLKLVPSRELFTQQSGADGQPEPIPREALHRYYFRVRIEGAELRLSPEPDEFGRMLPFAVDPPVMISGDGRKFVMRLQTRKPLLIYYPVPGGGPAWTLTLTGIAPA